MSHTVSRESFDTLAHYWSDRGHPLKWQPVFVLPAWLKVWWQELGPGADPYLLAVRSDDTIIGVAPLQISDGAASFVGNTDVCDYLDFVVAPGAEVEFFDVLLDDLRQKGVDRLDLRSLRPDSTVLTHLVDQARGLGNEVICRAEETSVELDLPATWDGYLELLDKKQRHELRRKFRRLWQAGNVEFRCVDPREETGGLMDTFLKLFALSRHEKASFMTARMESFFRSMAAAMAEIGLLRFGIVDLDGQPMAMTMCFDYDNVLYLYNSAYDPQYNHLSAGLLCKALCLRQGIDNGMKRFDFLKGEETYKYQLGGREVPLYECQIIMK